MELFLHSKTSMVQPPARVQQLKLIRVSKRGPWLFSSRRQPATHDDYLL